MADAAIDMQGSNLFSLGANFHTQTSSTNTMQDWPSILDSDGNVQCEKEVNNRTEYSQDVAYCNATPDIKTDLDTFLTAFGDVENSKLVDTITINFTAGEYATVSITGHNHDDNAHSEAYTADVSAIIPASSGFGCPDIWANSAGTTSSPVSVTVSLSHNHIDVNGSDGEHFVGKSITFRADVTAEYVGTPSLTTTGWAIDNETGNDGNSAFDGYSITAHKFFDAVAPE